MEKMFVILVVATMFVNTINFLCGEEIDGNRNENETFNKIVSRGVGTIDNKQIDTELYIKATEELGNARAYPNDTGGLNIISITHHNGSVMTRGVNVYKNIIV